MMMDHVCFLTDVPILQHVTTIQRLTCDDGSCLVDYGCNDSIACNYDSTATCDDGSCTYLDSPVTDLTAYNWTLCLIGVATEVLDLKN